MTSASRSVQLLETERLLLLVLGCGTVCQLTLFRVTHFLVTVENLKHFFLGSPIPLFCFRLVVLCGPCGFLARDSIYAIARYMPSPVRLSVCPSVCLSVRPSVCHTGGSVKDGSR